MAIFETCETCGYEKYKSCAKLGSIKYNPCVYCVKWNSNWNITSNWIPK